MNYKELNNGKLKVLIDTRKYKETILWGSKLLDEKLPASFMKILINTWRAIKTCSTAIKREKHGGEGRGLNPVFTLEMYPKLDHQEE